MICSAASRLAAAALAVALSGCAVLKNKPDDGMYNGELCVAVGAGTLNCGAAEVSLSNSRAKVRVSDMVYDLLLEDGQLDLMLVHGRTLVDVWSASYSWHRQFLHFIDEDRRVYYRVRFADPPPGDKPMSNGTAVRPCAPDVLANARRTDLNHDIGIELQGISRCALNDAGIDAVQPSASWNNFPETRSGWRATKVGERPYLGR